MKTRLSINKELDRIFHESCFELSIYPTCIQEGENDNRYEIEHQFDHDIYYLGVSIGMKKAQEIYRS